MARVARVVVPNLPHHVTQRGNRRQQTFFRSSDYLAYERSLRKWCTEFEVSVWAYCLMPNHVHLIVVPSRIHSLTRAIGETHRSYSVRINRRKDWKGYLWQGRFFSTPMDEVHLLLATRYVLLNPVRAGLVEHAEDWRFSSARQFLDPTFSGVTDVEALNQRIEDWRAFLMTDISEESAGRLREHTRTGWPLGSDQFLEGLERALDRRLRRLKPGPK